MIISMDKLLEVLDKDQNAIAMTSMPADPIHPGHISCLQNARMAIQDWYRIHNLKLPGITFICIVNDDNFLVNKKGFAFMPLEDRMQVIDAIKDGADYVVPFHPSDPSDQTVCEAIKTIKPNFFLKGGDRKADETLPEWNACKEANCIIIDRVGAEKAWSSSDYLKKHGEFIVQQVFANK